MNKENSANSGPKITGMGKEKDSATKLVWNVKEWLASLFNGVFRIGRPCGLPVNPNPAHLIDPKELTDSDSTEVAMVEEGAKGFPFPIQQQRDVVKRLSNGTQLCVIGVENQSLINYMMPLRVLMYDVLNYMRQAAMLWDTKYKKQGIKASRSEYLGHFYKDDHIVPCITLVVYYGTEPWDGPRCLADMFAEAPDSVKDLVANYPMYLLEINTLTEEELLLFDENIRPLLGYIRHSNDKDELRQYVFDNEALFKNVPQTLSTAMMAFTNDSVLRDYIEQNTEGGITDMCKATQDMWDSAVAEGEAKGEAKGRAEGKADLVYRFMKKMNISAEEAMEALSLKNEEKEAVRKALAG